MPTRTSRKELLPLRKDAESSHQGPTVHLTLNQAGLPASPFRQAAREGALLLPLTINRKKKRLCSTKEVLLPSFPPFTTLLSPTHLLGAPTVIHLLDQVKPLEEQELNRGQDLPVELRLQITPSLLYHLVTCKDLAPGRNSSSLLLFPVNDAEVMDDLRRVYSIFVKFSEPFPFIFSSISLLLIKATVKFNFPSFSSFFHIPDLRIDS